MVTEGAPQAVVEDGAGTIAAPRPAPPHFEHKLRAPLMQECAVVRDPLLNRLKASSQPVVTIVAPAGYGKTTLLGQWAGRTPPADFVRLDCDDNDPTVLLASREIAERLHVSPHTVRTQAVSISSKLGVSSRRGAIEEPVTVDLLDPAVVRFPDAPPG
jgi:ATP/maltotriose-dependent transcriptional regulator MalT